MIEGEEGGIKRPVTYLNEDDFIGIERYRKMRGFEKSWAITILVRVALELAHHDPELCDEFEKKARKN